MEKWTVVNCESPGSIHTVCQDCTAFYQDETVTAAALSDGALGCQFSNIGAKLAAEAACHEISAHFQEYYAEIRTEKDFVTAIQNHIKTYASESKPVNQMKCTLLFCAISGNTYLSGYIGDGAIIFFGEKSRILTERPENYVGGTTAYTILDYNASEHFTFVRGRTDGCDGFLIAGDGLIGKVYLDGSTTVSELAYTLFRSVYSFDPKLSKEERDAQIRIFLSEFIQKKDDYADDCSLAIIAREKCAGLSDPESSHPDQTQAKYQNPCNQQTFKNKESDSHPFYNTIHFLKQGIRRIFSGNHNEPDDSAAINLTAEAAANHFEFQFDRKELLEAACQMGNLPSELLPIGAKTEITQEMKYVTDAIYHHAKCVDILKGKGKSSTARHIYISGRELVNLEDNGTDLLKGVAINCQEEDTSFITSCLDFSPDFQGDINPELFRRLPSVRLKWDWIRACNEARNDASLFYQLFQKMCSRYELQEYSVITDSSKYIWLVGKSSQEWQMCAFFAASGQLYMAESFSYSDIKVSRIQPKELKKIFGGFLQDYIGHLENLNR